MVAQQAAAHGFSVEQDQARSGPVRVLTSFAEAEALWRKFEPEAITTPYQRFDWVDAFHSASGGSSPFIVVIEDEAHRPSMILPLEIARSGGLKVARFVGGTHSNFNFPLLNADSTIGDALRLSSVLRDAARAVPGGVDLFRLVQQPERWAGIANPLAVLPHQPTPSFGHHLTLSADGDATIERAISASSRKKLRKKERHLMDRGLLEIVQALDRADVERLTDVFLAQKARRCIELGIANGFAAPEMRAFIIDAATRGLGEGRPVIELYALILNGEAIATFAGAPLNGRFCGMFNSMTHGEITRDSPGEILLVRLIKSLCARGFTVFDLGVGEAAYKSSLCDGVDALFDTVIPVSAKGQVAAMAFAFATRAKRAIKQSPLLWPLIERYRRARGRAAVKAED
ncbi:MAG: GNAT family N-acetyltransferase [Alphaproteobacteria bacterium]